jgi:hypothetical protein
MTTLSSTCAIPNLFRWRFALATENLPDLVSNAKGKTILVRRIQRLVNQTHPPIARREATEVLLAFAQESLEPMKEQRLLLRVRWASKAINRRSRTGPRSPHVGKVRGLHRRISSPQLPTSDTWLRKIRAVLPGSLL